MCIRDSLIEAQGHVGVVQSLQIFCTILTSPENKKIIIPNGPLSSGAMVNYSAEGKIRVDTEVGISYDANIDQAKKVLQDMLAKDPRVLKNPAPTVAVSALADSAVNLVVRPWCDPAVYWDVFFDTLENTKKELDKVGIGIPYPQQDVHHYNQPA